MYLKNYIRRLLEYRLCLLKFKELGFEKVYSYYLAHEAGVSPEQVSKDFSKFAIKGNKKAGIKGIINFSPIILKVPDDVFVNNINLSLEFDTLIYYLK